MSLNRELGVGKLISLDARLIDNEGQFGKELRQPYGSERDFLTAGTRYDRYRPPFEGVLAPAEFRPLGPDSPTEMNMEQFAGVRYRDIPEPVGKWLTNNIGSEPAPANTWSLAFNGHIPNPDGPTVAIVAPFDIYFEGSEAFLSYTVPIIDAWETISAARATLIPEPSALCLLLLGMTFLGSQRRR